MTAPTHEEQADALEQALGAEERALLDRLADGLARRGLTAPAILFLDASRPLGFLASQALLFFRPFIAAFAGTPATYDRLTRLLERRGAVELLVRRLEARA